MHQAMSQKVDLSQGHLAQKGSKSWVRDGNLPKGMLPKETMGSFFHKLINQTHNFYKFRHLEIQGSNL